LYNFYFIQVEPAVPENIGASARALKTMGFDSLRLVKPADHLAEPARWLAHGSNDILEKAMVFDSFKNAVDDMDMIIGSTAKKRRVKYDYYQIDQLPKLIRSKGSTIQNIAIVFGREESGLTNEELQMCDLLTYIPMASPYPSLNLAQSVMLYAYTLSIFTHRQSKIDNRQSTIPPPTPSYPILKQKASLLLQQTGIADNQNLYNRIMERLAVLSENDIHILLSVVKSIIDINNDLEDDLYL